MSEVSIPRGISEPVSVLLNLSTIMRKQAPNEKETGISFLLSFLLYVKFILPKNCWRKLMKVPAGLQIL